MARETQAIDQGLTEHCDPGSLSSMSTNDKALAADTKEQERLAALAAQEVLFAAYRTEYNAVGYEWVEIADIAPVPGYQREKYQGHINSIIKNFVPALIVPPLLNKVAGKKQHYEAVDGQHTIEVLRTIGVTRIWSRVVDMTYQQAAGAFGAQTHKPLKRPEKFFARVEAGEEKATDIMRTMERRGFTPMRANYNGKRIKIKAMFEVEKIVDHYGIDHLDATLKFAQSTWPIEDGKDGGYFLRGLADFLSRYPADELTHAHISNLQGATPQNYANAGAGLGAQDHRVKAIMLALRAKALGRGGRTRARQVWIPPADRITR